MIDKFESYLIHASDQSDNQRIRSNTYSYLCYLVFFPFLISLLFLVLIILSVTNYDVSLSIDDHDSVFILNTVSKPNIVFILADDLGWNSIGYENFDLHFTTPFLDTLAKQGIIFNNYYSQEVCTPARTALLTGKYPVSVGMQFGDIDYIVDWGLNTTEVLLPEVLKSEGNYKTYILGKWGLGHSSPEYLPTARGFDYFFGYLNGKNSYWTKKYPGNLEFYDFLESDVDCYHGYDESDRSEYSTFLYRDKAIDIIQTHNYSEAPMFLYFAAQAVHDPFTDIDHDRGITANDYNSYDLSVYNKIETLVKGAKRQEYAKALYLLDNAVESIYSALVDVGELENTFIIFRYLRHPFIFTKLECLYIISSDNGGCFKSGGKNGPLRGTKGSLFEGTFMAFAKFDYLLFCEQILGGTKVDAFMFSPLIKHSYRGVLYSSLMHISDWFPTILDLVNISYSFLTLDGVSHAKSMFTGDSPREYMLYNYYSDVEFQDFLVYYNPFAIRNSQYKLMHTYEDNSYAEWYNYDEIDNTDDTALVDYSCIQKDGLYGNFTMQLYDIINDPYEKVNLYSHNRYKSIKVSFMLISLISYDH